MTAAHNSPGTRVLFLDFDGVLHSMAVKGNNPSKGPVIGTGLFDWLPSLADALGGHEDVDIVVHSTWRYAYSLDELREMLGSLKNRVVGATPRGPRLESILWWLSLSPTYTDYRILDDDPKEFPDPQPTELILCNPLTGVAAPEVLETLRVWLQT